MYVLKRLLTTSTNINVGSSEESRKPLKNGVERLYSSMQSSIDQNAKTVNSNVVMAPPQGERNRGILPEIKNPVFTGFFYQTYRIIFSVHHPRLCGVPTDRGSAIREQVREVPTKAMPTVRR